MNMRLELANFPVKDVRFNGRTGYHNGVLEIDKEELVKLVLQDKRVASVDLDVAFPGEQTRIVFIRDVIEPRVKVSGPGCVFPGILCPVETVGEGRTHRLSGVTVIVSAEYRSTLGLAAGMTVPHSGVVDMWGQGSLMSPLGSTINIVLILQLIDNMTELDAHAAIQLAEFKVANRLAETTKDKTPQNVEAFELSEVDPSLPRVVYIACVVTLLADTYPHSGVAIYAMPLGASLATFIHPNEFLDGALTTDARIGSSAFSTTWDWMNLPGVFELLRQHGKRLNFLGVILQRTRFTAESGKRVTAATTSQMVRLLGADGAIITLMNPSGNNYMDVMFTLQACERKGVKTVLVTPEWGSTDTEIALPFYVPEATAIVSAGSGYRELKLPAPAKVIGAREGQPIATRPEAQLFSPWDEITFDNHFELSCGVDWFGGRDYACKEY